MTVEPRMEELLASIRKAIQDDIGDGPAGNPVAPMGRVANQSVTGAMRELRVRVADEVTSAAAEIDGLRERIQRNRVADSMGRDRAPAATAAPTGAHAGRFNAALSGDPEVVTPTRAASAESVARAEMPRYEPQFPPPPNRAAPPLRPSFAETELPPAERYRPQPAYGRFGRDVEASQELSSGWREPPAALPAPEPELPPTAGPILSDDTAYATSAAFNRLTETLLSRALGDRSVEEMTREMLRTMLKQWLDDNLPGLVERLVREEIERVARRGR